MQTKEFYPPLDVGYILGLSGPPQGTSRTDNVADVMLKNMLCGAIAEATNIWLTITELNAPSGRKYGVALNMDVKSLGKCQTEENVGVLSDKSRKSPQDQSLFIAITNLMGGTIAANGSQTPAIDVTPVSPPPSSSQR